eukprot:scaffold26790_cov58-Phaeocystis_antarctica.AAC.2
MVSRGGASLGLSPAAMLPLAFCVGFFEDACPLACSATSSASSSSIAASSGAAGEIAASCGVAACCRMSSAIAACPAISAHCRAVLPPLSSSSVLALARSRACTHSS